MKWFRQDSAVFMPLVLVSVLCSYLSPPRFAYEVQDQSDGALYWKIGEARVAMPAWNGIVDDDERWSLVNYIRSLKEMDATESN
jgi:mono/diheme cytochrome c family protein